MLLVGLLYGINYSIVKLVSPAFLEPLGFIVYRVGIATLIFWIIGIFIPEQVDWKADGKQFFWCAFFGVGLNMPLFFQGVSMTSAINASIITTLTPVIVFVVAIFLLKERITGWRLLGLVIGLLGAMLIVYEPDSADYQGNWMGDSLIFLNAISYGVYLVLAKPLLKKYKPITITKWVFLMGLVVVVPLGFRQAISPTWEIWSPVILFSMAYVIIGVTVVVYLINIWAMKKVSPGTVGVYTYVQPVFAVLVASLFFEERLLWQHLLAALLVFSGVGLVIKK